MNNDKTNYSQLDLECEGHILLSYDAFILRAEGIPDLVLAIPDLRARLHLIRWSGRLLDLMHARLNDTPVRLALVGKWDIPDVVVSLGTAWTRLHWPCGTLALSASDVERTLELLGVDVPVYRWQKHCLRQAAAGGIMLEPEFLE